MSPGARACCLAIQVRTGMFQSRLVGEDEAPVTANAPGVVNARVDPAFAHREAPERKRFGDHELSLFRRLDLEAPLKPRPVVDQRLLRQPDEPRARREAQAGSRWTAAGPWLR